MKKQNSGAYGPQIDSVEFPIGFLMELAQHTDVLNRFSQLPENEQHQAIEKSREIHSRQEMRQYVESIFKF